MHKQHNGYVRSHGIELSILYRIFDIAIVLGCLFLTALLRNDSFSEIYQLLGIVMASIFTVVAESANLYRSWRTTPALQQAKETISVWIICIFILLVLGYFLKVSAVYSRVTLGSWLLITPTILIFCRLLLRQSVAVLRAMGFNTRRAVIIGVTENGIRLKEQLLLHKGLGIHFVGFYDDRELDRLEHSEIESIVGNVDQALELAKQGDIDHVYVAMPMEAKSRIVEYLSKFSDTTATTYLVPDFFTYNLLHSRWHSLGNIQTLSVFDSPFRGGDRVIKRLQDVLLSLIIITLISPVLFVIAIGLKCTSPGPVLFKQYRYGLDGKRINVLKFRSMIAQENGDVVKQATKDDPRVTKLGAFLRRTSLDELPQFFNVLQGSMSIVGPRPHAVAHNEEYRAIVDRYMLRHKVKPGITGLAQINGFRGETDTLDKMEKRVQFDLEYIQNWTIWLDLKIIFITVFRGFVSKTAY